MTSLPLLALTYRPRCTKCELHIEAKHPGVPGIHYDQSRFPSPESPFIIVMGMNPGMQEDLANLPFIGPTGRMLKTIYLPALNILETHAVYFLNAARCCTPGNTQLKNSHIKACWENNLYDIKQICEYHNEGTGSILCLGTHAVTAVTKNLMGKALNLKSALESQGSAIAFEGRDLLFFCTYHPAGVMRQQNLKYPVAEHLELIGQQLKGDVPSPSSPSIIPIRSPR